MPSPKVPTVIRDPVHDVIPFEPSDQDRLLLALINTREFQRLRRVKQLGMAEMVFPGANHSRFAHSIGVMHNARRFVEAVVKSGAPLDPDQQMAVAAAALLHDVGHGPFSHAFEKVTRDKHEGRTREIILSDATEVNATLKGVDPELPKRIANFFDVEEDADEENADVGAEKDAEGNAAIPEDNGNAIPPFASQIISSQLDADRTDFLLRDSHATGTDYGRFDLNWLVRSLKYIEVKKVGKIVVGLKGQSSVEQYIFARRNMYLRCYFHKTCRAAEVMLRHIFERFRNLIESRGIDDVAKLVVGINPILLRAFSGKEKIPLIDYLELDDCSITEFFRVCAVSTDPTLAYLGKGLLHRRLYKVIDASDLGGERIGNFRAKVQEVLNKSTEKLPAEFPTDFMCEDDTIKDTPYKPYSPDERPLNQIFVETAEGKVAELNTVSPRVVALAREESLLRYIFPAELDGDIRPIAEATLRGGK